MKKSDFSSAERVQHKLQIWECIYKGMGNQSAIARRLGALTTDSNGTHKNWYVHDHLHDLISMGYVIELGYMNYKITEEGFDWFLSSPLGDWALTDFSLRQGKQ
jgi:predicted transcriptional regulator